MKTEKSDSDIASHDGWTSTGKIIFSSLLTGVLLLTVGLIHDNKTYRNQYHPNFETSFGERRPAAIAICGPANNEISLSSTQSSLLVLALLTSAYSIILATNQYLKKSTRARNVTMPRRYSDN